MAIPSFNLGNGKWASKENAILGYKQNSEGVYGAIEGNVTRASTKTRVNASGLIEEVPIGVASIDYLDNVNGALKCEPQSTNLITYSNDFTNGVWVKTNSSITSNQAISPDGTQNADLMTSTLAGSYIVFSVAVANPCTFSVFAKYNTQQFIQLHCGASASFYANFDIQNGVVGTKGGLTTNVKIEDYGNGWYRCSATFTTIAVGSSVLIGFAETLSSTWGGLNSVSGNSLYLYQSQHENLSYATSPIFTSGSTVTRLADAVSGAGDSSTFNSQEGTIVLKGVKALAEDGTNRNIYLNATATPTRYIGFRITSGNKLATICFDGTNVPFIVDASTSILSENNIAITYNTSQVDFYVNGALIGSDSTWVGIGTGLLDELRLSSNTLADPFFGTIKGIYTYNSVLSLSEIQSLTS